MHTLDISQHIRIPMAEIRMTAVRSQGAGGQNVNKVATAIHLRFDSQNCTALPNSVKQRLMQLADHRITDQGVVTIKSQAYRSQARNRVAALSRLTELLQSTLRVQKRRIPTQVSKQAKRKRLDDKTRRGDLKKSRRKVQSD